MGLQFREAGRIRFRDLPYVRDGADVALRAGSPYSVIVLWVDVLVSTLSLGSAGHEVVKSIEILETTYPACEFQFLPNNIIEISRSYH